MPRYSEAHMQDNPQPGDDPDGSGNLIPERPQTSEDRPHGETGVEKAHGGGSAGLESMSSTGRDGGGERARAPANPRNPDDPRNPASSTAGNQPSMGGLVGSALGAAQSAEGFVTASGARVPDGPVTTHERASQRQERESREGEGAERQKETDQRNKDMIAESEKRQEQDRKRQHDDADEKARLAREHAARSAEGSGGFG